jgi:hypothetical protein
VPMVWRQFHIGCLGVCIAECCWLVVIPLGLLLVRRDIISMFNLWTLAPKSDMTLEIM